LFVKVSEVKRAVPSAARRRTLHLYGHSEYTCGWAFRIPMGLSMLQVIFQTTIIILTRK
jgi:hypothetical protein